MGSAQICRAAICALPAFTQMLISAASRVVRPLPAASTPTARPNAITPGASTSDLTAPEVTPDQVNVAWVTPQIPPPGSPAPRGLRFQEARCDVATWLMTY